MADVHSFVPRREQARGDSLVGAAVAGALVFAVFYLGRGERDPRILAGFSALGAALVLCGFLVRTSLQWVDEIRLTDESATLVRDQKEQTLPWTAVKSVRHVTSGGDQWILSTHPGHLPMTIRAEGLTRDQAARLRDLIPRLHAAASSGATGQGG